MTDYAQVKKEITRLTVETQKLWEQIISYIEGNPTEGFSFEEAWRAYQEKHEQLMKAIKLYVSRPRR